MSEEDKKKKKGKRSKKSARTHLMDEPDLSPGVGMQPSFEEQNTAAVMSPSSSRDEHDRALKKKRSKERRPAATDDANVQRTEAFTVPGAVQTNVNEESNVESSGSPRIVQQLSQDERDKAAKRAAKASPRRTTSIDSTSEESNRLKRAAAATVPGAVRVNDTDEPGAIVSSATTEWRERQRLQDERDKAAKRSAMGAPRRTTSIDSNSEDSIRLKRAAAAAVPGVVRINDGDEPGAITSSATNDRLERQRVQEEIDRAAKRAAMGAPRRTTSIDNDAENGIKLKRTVAATVPGAVQVNNADEPETIRTTERLEKQRSQEDLDKAAKRAAMGAPRRTTSIDNNTEDGIKLKRTVAATVPGAVQVTNAEEPLMVRSEGAERLAKQRTQEQLDQSAKRAARVGPARTTSVDSNSEDGIKLKRTAAAIVPGAVQVNNMEEPGSLVRSEGAERVDNQMSQERLDKATKRAARGGISPTSVDSNAGDSIKLKRTVAATVPGAVQVNNLEGPGAGKLGKQLSQEELDNGAKQGPRRTTSVDGNSEDSVQLKRIAATTGGSNFQSSIQENPGPAGPTTVAAYGLSKPARVDSGEVVMPGVVYMPGMTEDMNDVQKEDTQLTEKDVVSKNHKDRNSDMVIPGALAVVGLGAAAVTLNAGAQAVSGTDAEDMDAAIRRKDPRAAARRNTRTGASSTTASDRQRNRVDAKFQEMEDGRPLEPPESRSNDKFGDDGFDKSDQFGADKSDQFGIAPTSVANLTTGDRGVGVAPDVEYGTTGVGYGGEGYGGVPVDDDGLAIAIAVDDDEDDAFLPAAIEYDPDAKPPLYKNRRFRLYFILGLIVTFAIVVGVTVGVLATKDSGPAAVPTAAPTTALEMSYLSQFKAEFGENVMIEGTPHDRAANWIMFEDELKLPVDAPNLIQRYALALFYFITTNNGERLWRSCNQPTVDEDATCVFQRYQLNNDDTQTYVPEPATRWLSNKHECDWVGNLCDDGQVLRALECWGQNITGTLPTEVTALQSLQSLSLAFNDFTGSIPFVEYTQMRHLLNLELHYNSLTGTIPESFWNASIALQAFNIGNNLLSGTLSTNVGQLSNLKGLHIFENILEGTIPTEIGKLGVLSFTRMSSNRFTGKVPTEIGGLVLLQELWMHTNQFTGTLPTQIGNLADLTDIRFELNRLTGTIPEALYNLQFLIRIYLHDLTLSGTLSTSISKLTRLQDLRLARNKLTGTIPTEFALLSNLKLAWFQFNEFTGSIPQGICANRGDANNGDLGFLNADCGPEGNPAQACDCCTSCCDRSSGICIIQK